ncbi:MAG: hypothetical protein AVDCRST_MAG87-1535 [uncultured Thermomicrobiales bacterium]|uniref:Major facilitator superfamily (MFS) profile domain-containing protein n=1 Tax=uncultured Thermomicrobiales bacterium TaxID=1645740 RepID=A0A6J4UWK6_9BACT|nr:MAG: hypothetical protein AVDCRST_MAG87-1535 [uncultured Thermomicrobiales bacterium]
MADRSTLQSRGPLYALLAANVVSQTGNSLSYLAIPWFVLTTTGSATSTGIAVAVGALPVIIVGIFGGAIVDRLGYKPTSVVSDIASCVAVLLIPILHQTVGIAFWQLLVLVFLGALLDMPGSAARGSLFPELVAGTGLTLERANAAYSVTGRLASTLSAPVGGILIAALGATTLLYLNAVSFAISAAIVALRVPSRRVPGTTSDAARRIDRYLADVREGFAFLYRDRLLLWMVLSFSIGGLVAEPLYAVILPVYAHERYGSAINLGFIFTGLAVGSIVGNVIFAGLNQRLPRSGVIIGGFALRAAAFWALVFVPPWGVIAGAIFIGAVLFEPINPLFMTIFQKRVPSGMRGRVLGAVAALGAGTFPLGIATYGYLLDRIDLDATLLLFVIVNTTLPVAMYLTPVLRNIRVPVAADQVSSP